MKRCLMLSFFCCITCAAMAQNNSTDIVENNSTHISRLTKDSVVLVSGSTYLFTVDTPEDQGLVPTRITGPQLFSQIKSMNGSVQTYTATDKNGNQKAGDIEAGDHLVVKSHDGKSSKSYNISFESGAIGGQLRLEKSKITTNTNSDVTIYFTAGQRSPNTTVRIYLPAGIEVTGDNTTVNVIGRGAVKLNDLATQSMGRLGTNYPYKKVGNFSVSKDPNGGSVLLFKHLDLRPANGIDLKIRISNVNLKTAGNNIFKVVYNTLKPEVLTSPGIGSETTELTATPTVSDLERVLDKSLQYKEIGDTYTKVNLKWGSNIPRSVEIRESKDGGKNYIKAQAKINYENSAAVISNLRPNQHYSFKLLVKDGEHKGLSNAVEFYSGKMDIKNYNVKGDGKGDDTKEINAAIDWLHSIGGGTLLFSDGIYNVRAVHLKSNVYLYVDNGATIKAIKGGDEPESTWFSDKKYRSGLSPSDRGPYEDPENYMTKQDVGHHYFNNSMFFGERLDNIKIIGNGRITGDGNLATGDNVMKNATGNRSDKMFTFKLCTNLEIGGIYRKEDLWYDSVKDEPYYIGKGEAKSSDIANMLHIDRSGHFVLLATGTDNINVHDTYFGKNSTSNVRDIYDFMQCNHVMATNIYCEVSSDDIIKPGSDCSLGYTRPAKNYKVRNIIGDTNCNLFQIGSETADDIQDVHVDNIYVLGANKAGFSISTNDGAHIKDIHLNCGHTGTLHSRSKMLRTTTPFFISISNRGRVLGANVSKFKFDENGVKHDELLVTNVNIGSVENIILNGVDVSEVYSGSSYGGKERWKPYDGTQKKATAIVAGYALPDSAVVEGNLNFKLPNGEHTGYIKNISFNDVQFLYKGGNPVTDSAATPPELGVGQYNVSNLKVQPSYGLWARHAMGITINNCSFNYEQPDSRYALFLDDVNGARILKTKMVRSTQNKILVRLKNSRDVMIDNVVYYNNAWGTAPAELQADHTTGGIINFVQKK